MSAFDIPQTKPKVSNTHPTKALGPRRPGGAPKARESETISQPGVTPSRTTNWRVGEYKPDQRMSEALERARAEQPALISMGESLVPLAGQAWR